MRKLRIAIQSKGRLSEASISFLNSLGLEFKPNGRQLIQTCENEDLEILYLRSEDIPEYVRCGVADFGIVGRNVLEEKGLDLNIIKNLDFGACELVIAIPKTSSIKSLKDLEGERIATSYPRTLSRFLKTASVNAAVIPIRGSVEITPSLNLADGICDLTQTGKTLQENGLVVMEKILDSRAVLVENPSSNPYKSNFIKRCKS